MLKCVLSEWISFSETTGKLKKYKSLNWVGVCTGEILAELIHAEWKVKLWIPHFHLMEIHLVLQVDYCTAGLEILSVTGPQIFWDPKYSLLCLQRPTIGLSPDEAVVYSTYTYTCVCAIQSGIPWWLKSSKTWCCAGRQLI